jgi:glycosyltransferase involved in cell wall biosynthesis
MRVLVVNYRYFVSGGPERYLFNVKDALEKCGHEIIPFSIHYSKNVPTPYAKYFVEPLAGRDAVTFDDHAPGFRALWKTVERSFYSPEVERAITRLIADTKPDIAYVQHYLKKLSPSVLVGIKKHRLPIVVRLSDFLMLCPQALFLRDGKACTLCAEGGLWPSVKYRCVKGSLAASLIHVAATQYHRRRGYFDLIDRFVAPSPFTLEQMAAAGWARDKLVHIPTFVAPEFLAAPPAADKTARPYFLFVGHFDPHKGPDVLIRAYAEAVGRSPQLPARLVMVGGPDRPFAIACRDLARSLGIESRVEFQDFKSAAELRPLYAGALATVIPSICFENMPNVLLESYACGTPVIGSDHGSIGELIRDGETGYRFRPGDVADLAGSLIRADSAWRAAAGPKARRYAEEHFRMDRHLDQLLALFESLLGGRS